MKYRIAPVLPALLWTLLILAACSVPGQSLPSVSVLGVDKVVHFGLFAGFGWLWMRVATSEAGVRWVLAGGLLYAVLTELYQGLLPWERQPDVFDAVANALGLVVGVFLFRAFRARRAGVLP